MPPADDTAKDDASGSVGPLKEHAWGLSHAGCHRDQPQQEKAGCSTAIAIFLSDTYGATAIEYGLIASLSRSPALPHLRPSAAAPLNGWQGVANKVGSNLNEIALAALHPPRLKAPSYRPLRA